MTTRRLRLCMKDLYHQDVVRMVERETRDHAILEVTSAEAPLFSQAYGLLWQAFGPEGELEREEVVRGFMAHDATQPTRDGTFIRYFMLVVVDAEGRIGGVRDGAVLVNQAYAEDLCLVYLSHIYMVPRARGTVMSYWMRIAPVELAMGYLRELAALGRVELPEPDAPGRNFGMRVDLAAEMEYFAPEEDISWRRILFYGRGGFDAIEPQHFPYRQPDFRDPEQIAATGYQPKPFMLLVRRMGRERRAKMAIREAKAIMNLLYDHFETHCPEPFLVNSLDLVLDRLDELEHRGFVRLLPLPTGPHDLGRLRPLSRYHVFRRSYKGEAATLPYLQGGVSERVKADPRHVEHEIARIAEHMRARPEWVYANRDHGFTWEGLPLPGQDLSEP